MLLVIFVENDMVENFVDDVVKDILLIEFLVILFFIRIINNIIS